jgi:hypothetical protein
MSIKTSSDIIGNRTRDIPACSAVPQPIVQIKIFGIVIFPVVLYGYEACSATFRLERGLRLFENRMLRHIFDPKRDEVIGNLTKLCNEELYGLSASPNVILEPN